MSDTPDYLNPDKGTAFPKLNEIGYKRKELSPSTISPRSSVSSAPAESEANSSNYDNDTIRSEQLKGQYETARAEKARSYHDLISQLSEQQARLKVMSEEERAAAEKRRKRESLIAAIGDGFQAASNLFFTNKYAPNMYKHSGGMSEKSKERWQAIYSQDEKNREARLRLALQQAQLKDSLADDAKNAYDGELSRKAAAEENAREWDYKNKTHDLNKQRLDLEKQKEENRDSRAENLLQFKKDKQKQDHDIAAQNAKSRAISANASSTRANSYRGSKSEQGAGGKYFLIHPDGTTHYYNSKQEHDQAFAFYYPKEYEETLHTRTTQIDYDKRDVRNSDRNTLASSALASADTKKRIEEKKRSQREAPRAASAHKYSPAKPQGGGIQINKDIYKNKNNKTKPTGIW